MAVPHSAHIHHHNNNNNNRSKDSLCTIKIAGCKLWIAPKQNNNYRTPRGRGAEETHLLWSLLLPSASAGLTYLTDAAPALCRLSLTQQNQSACQKQFTSRVYPGQDFKSTGVADISPGNRGSRDSKENAPSETTNQNRFEARRAGTKETHASENPEGRGKRADGKSWSGFYRIKKTSRRETETDDGLQTANGLHISHFFILRCFQITVVDPSHSVAITSEWIPFIIPPPFRKTYMYF